MSVEFQLTPADLLAAGYVEVSGLYIGPRCPLPLRERIASGWPVHLVARQSGERTDRVNLSVARDAYENADDLSRQLDIVAHFALPSETALAALLHRSTRVVNAVDADTGKPFRTVFANLDLRGQGVALVMTLTAGSGSKIDQATEHSPAAMALAKDVRAFKPALVFAKRQDRMFRQGYAQGPFRRAVDRLASQGIPVAIGDGAKGLWSDSPFERADSFIKGEQDRAQAKEIVSRTRTSMVQHTGLNPRMENGWIPYHLPSRLPPGFTRVRLIGRHATGTIKRLYIDTPDNLPPQEQCLSVLPLAHDADGNVADQVAILRWYFENAGPDWGSTALGFELVRRGASNDGRRRAAGPSASIGPEHMYWFQEAIWRNLDLYQYGIWRRKMGSQEVVLENLFPPDGQRWGPDERFEQVRAWRTRTSRAHARRASVTFGGLRVQRDGLPARLIRSYEPDLENLGRINVRYLLERDHHSDAGDEWNAEPRTNVWVEHDWIAEAILTALRDAQRVPVPPCTGDNTDPELARLQAGVLKRTQAVTNLEQAIAMARADVAERIPGTQEHVMNPTARRARWDEITQYQHQLNQAHAAAARADEDLSSYVVRQTELRRGVHVATMADVLVSLLDPLSVTYQRLWKTAIHNMTISSRTFSRCGVRGRNVSFSFQLNISDGDVTVALPVTGSHDIGSVAELPRRAAELLDGLRAGIPVDPRTTLNQQKLTLRYLRRHVLACDDGRTAFLQCRQPDLLGLGMSVLFPTGSVEDAVAEAASNDRLLDIFNKPDVLARRLLAIYPPLRAVKHGWTIKISQHEARALALAGENGGTVTKDMVGRLIFYQLRDLANTSRAGLWTVVDATLHLHPCRSCHKFDLVAFACRDVDGYVCLHCRTDRSGVTWPGRLFDPFIAMPQLWTERGWTLDTQLVLPEASAKIGTGTPPRRRALSEVTSAEREAIRADAAADLPRQRIAAKYGLTEQDVRHVVGRGGTKRTKSDR